jgi:hypothetical protein
MELTNCSTTDVAPCFIKNKKVIDFYREHNNKFDFELVNLHFVELFEKVMDSEGFKSSQFFEDFCITKDITNAVIGEKKMEILLCNMHPTDEVVINKNDQLQCDFILKRYQKPTILFECKECNVNIDTDVTDCFIETLKASNQSGIFISQHSGIINKPNFYIEIYNGNILVYIQNCNYEVEKIKSAIEIIDNLYSKLKSVNNNDNIIINLQLLNEINKEYQLFLNYKESLIKSIKENNNTIIKHIENFKFDNLDKYLSTKFITTKSNTPIYKCDICSVYTSKTLKGIAAHKKGCKKKCKQVVVV